jgi:hypothetical protein
LKLQFRGTFRSWPVSSVKECCQILGFRLAPWARSPHRHSKIAHAPEGETHESLFHDGVTDVNDALTHDLGS